MSSSARRKTVQKWRMRLRSPHLVTSMVQHCCVTIRKEQVFKKKDKRQNREICKQKLFCTKTPWLF